jgi:putative FmdB family regulatory protein
MPVYEHHCNSCDLDWLEEYSFKDDPPETCPECESTDCYRCVTTSGTIIFKGGGWSPEGYNKHSYLDKYKDQGVKIYDRKEDHDREKKGEAEAAELKKLKHLDEVAKRTLGPDAGVTQAEADKAIKKAGEESVK